MKIILFMLIFSCTTAVFADTEVSCWDNSCLKNGWSSYNFNTGTSANNACYREGCEISGWISERTYTQCKGQGCFNEGWYVLNRSTQAMESNVLCLRENCLTSGWVFYGSTGLQKLITCTEGDCETKGWSVQTQTGYSQVTCKNGGCWNEGWVEIGN